MPPLVDADLELTHYSGAVIPLALVTVRDRSGIAQPRSIRAALSAASADEPLGEWLEAYVQETWIGGCGGGGPLQGYAQAPGLVTRIGNSRQGSAFPGPAEHAVPLPAANDSASRLVMMEQFAGNLYISQSGTPASANTARVLVAPGGGASLSDSLGGASAYGVAAGNSITDLLLFRNQGGTKQRRLWAAGNDADGARLHYTEDGTSWTSTASGAFKAAHGGRYIAFDWLAKVYWRTANGDQAWRMVAGDHGGEAVSYTRPGADPFDPASWVLDAFSVDTVGGVTRPPSIRRRLLLPAQDGLFDVDELGDTPNILNGLDRHSWNGYASFYLEDYVYLTYQSTIGRIYVGEPGLLQTTPGVCGPGAFTEAEHEFNGWATCFTGDQGNIVAATYNPNNGKTGIWWGRDRKHYPEVETANPLLWWGPEIFSERSRFVTAMKTFTNLELNTLHLWVAAVPYGSSASIVAGPPTLAYFTLPMAGQPLSDFLTGGANEFAVGSSSGDWQPRCELLALPYTWKDKGSTKYLNDITIGSRGLDAAGDGTTMNLLLRADPEPAETAFPPGVGVDTSPVAVVSPGTTTSGHKTQYLVRLFSPHGADTLATRAVGVLDAVRITAFRRAPTVRVLDVTCQFGHGIRSLSGGVDPSATPDEIRDLLADLTTGDRTTLRIRPDRRFTVLCRQVLDETDELIGNEERQTVRMQLGILADL